LYLAWTKGKRRAASVSPCKKRRKGERRTGSYLSKAGIVRKERPGCSSVQKKKGERSHMDRPGRCPDAFEGGGKKSTPATVKVARSEQRQKKNLITTSTILPA